jgi:hypothetical protein|tara:strand:+ start:734 stop:958 length:225 start_codon:yes stop_codon:yes gene_type:complete
MNTIKETLTETATAFRDRLLSYDTESMGLYTLEAKGRLERLEASLIRLYDNGCISPADFKRFDAMLFDRIARLY